MTEPLLKVDNLALHFPQGRGLFASKSVLKAVDGVSLEIAAGETLGLVGESGCGKSSLGKAILKLYPPTTGSVQFENRDITGLNNREMRPVRRQMQMIFQDPFESLNSRHTVATILEEPLIIHHWGDRPSRQKKVAELLDRVGLPTAAANKYPHEFSGGQRQRIGIARAIALEPKLLICDEPVSALDVSVQAQILNLLVDIQRDMGLAMLFISHDLSVVRHMSDRIAVMYLGQLVEVGPAESIYQSPRHPYTQILLQSVPRIGEPMTPPSLPGELPSPIDMPNNCRFSGRCPYQTALCQEQAPVLQKGNQQHLIACHHWQDLPA